MLGMRRETNPFGACLGERARTNFAVSLKAIFLFFSAQVVINNNLGQNKQIATDNTIFVFNVAILYIFVSFVHFKFCCFFYIINFFYLLICLCYFVFYEGFFFSFELSLFTYSMESLHLYQHFPNILSGSVS